MLFRKPAHKVPERPRPLAPDEVAFLQKELTGFRRWKTFWTVAVVPMTPVGLIAGVGGIYALVFGYPMQSFFMGVFLSLVGFAPLYAFFAMRDQVRNIERILEESERIPQEAGEDAAGP